MNKEKKLDWSRLGDIETGRKNLGSEMPVAVYRLLQYTIHDELSDTFGEKEGEELIRRAGFRAGVALAENALDLTLHSDAFISQLQKTLREMKIGILRIEKADWEKMEIVLTVDEDLDCSGLPMLGDTVCVYDEGFIAGIFEAYTKKVFHVREIDCWATGARTCRFSANSVK